MATILQLQNNIKVLNAKNLKITTELNKEKEINAQNKVELVKLQTAVSDSNQAKETLLAEQKRLNIEIESQKTKIAGITKLENDIKVLNVANLKIATELNTEKEDIKVLTADKLNLTTELKKEKELSAQNKTELVRLQTAVSDSNQAKETILTERNELSVKVQEFQHKIIELENDNKRLQAEVENHGASEDLSQEGFTSFISDTLRDLENKMQTQVSVDEDKKFVVKEMEIEAKVIFEKKGNKGIYVFPTAEKLKNIAPDQLQKIKFMIKSSPKIT